MEKPTEGHTLAEKATRIVTPERPRRSAKAPAVAHFGQSAFDAWPEISARLHAANQWAFLLDLDGTLLNIRRHPKLVRASSRVNGILKRLIRHPNCFVAIVSGRKVRDLRELVGVTGLHYFGVHGADREGKRIALDNKTVADLASVKRAVRKKLAHLTRVWIEDKGPGFCVHYREASPAVTQTAAACLSKALEPWGDSFYVMNGKRIWEVLPSAIEGKSSAVKEVLAKLPAGTLVVCIGDDETDERAFAALAGQITIRVGKTTATKARYWLRSPAEVLRFLTRAEGELP